jgi:hypothetical protein
MTRTHDLACLVEQAHLSSTFATDGVARASQRTLLRIESYDGTPVALPEDVPSACCIPLDISSRRHLTYSKVRFRSF